MEESKFNWQDSAVRLMKGCAYFMVEAGRGDPDKTLGDKPYAEVLGWYAAKISQALSESLKQYQGD